MLRIGLIGAESQHCTAYAHTINNEKHFPNVKISALWGETPALAQDLALKAQIPLIVTDPQEMIGAVDAVIIAHRRGSQHLNAAQPFLSAAIPMFIDKPFCTNAKETQSFLQQCQEKNIPITSFSVSPLQQKFKAFQEELTHCQKILHLCIAGWADYQSIYDGLFFYGYHHIELCQSLMGTELLNIHGNRNGTDFTGHLSYSQNRSATLSMNSEAKGQPFCITAYTTQGPKFLIATTDPNPYLVGMEKFITMFQTGICEPSTDRLVQAIQIAETFQKIAEA